MADQRVVVLIEQDRRRRNGAPCLLRVLAIVETDADDLAGTRHGRTESGARFRNQQTLSAPVIEGLLGEVRERFAVGPVDKSMYVHRRPGAKHLARASDIQNTAFRPQSKAA